MTTIPENQQSKSTLQAKPNWTRAASPTCIAVQPEGNFSKCAKYCLSRCRGPVKPFEINATIGNEIAPTIDMKGESAMRRVSSTVGFLLILLALGCPVTHADTIDFLISGTYAGDVPVSPLSSPNSAFSLSFSLPHAPPPLFSNGGFFPVTAPLTVGFSRTTTTDPLSLIFFFTEDSGGLFDVHATVGGNEFLWSLFGPQAFSGSTSSPTLLGGS